jgi:hypothetical protein
MINRGIGLRDKVAHTACCFQRTALDGGRLRDNWSRADVQLCGM